ncbi:iron complex outermembrane receptor protein [Sphingobacterium allocomposti]|uniref:Iron complex outermembrane receptor protein n=1 Tax=Sphingobacterium allocomposti TaxID=415956 RepID=A0A5S5CWK7_9SPHI|nr:TonB-dependent receptor [Sphingobacterium composti Yoo et al. 2007 non Ten et al. 2007]TYP88190.1 iron complex outermembrane receptor protein [Sphingobacterium composti Yoo et al. 2007 non Ten et al. 2007]
MRNILYILCLLLPLATLAQQKTEVSGRVLTSDGRPAEGITVRLMPHGQTSFTNTNGRYVFKDVTEGSHTLSVSAVGLQARNSTVEVAGNKTMLPDIHLSESSAALEEIVVIGNINKYTRKSSPYVAKMPLKNLENPQSYTVVTKELLQSQVNTNFDDALANVSGVDKLWGATGRPGDGVSYYTLRGFSTQASMVNGVVSISSTSPDPANLETIEVIKGPSGSLYGGAAIGFGGLINNVTKKPVDTLGGRINYIFGTFGQHRLTADVHGPLAGNNKLLGRVNAAYTHTGTWQDAGFNKSFFVAPSLLYRPNERLNLHLEAEIFQSKATNPLMVFLNRARQLYARTPDELQFDFNKSYTNSDVTFQTPATNLRGTATYRINSSWTSNTTLNYNRRKSDGYFQYVMFLQPGNDTLINRFAADQDYVAKTVNAQQNFVGDFRLGNMRNRILIGADYLFQQAETHNSPYVLVDQINTSYDDPDYYKFNAASIDAAIAASNGAETNNRSRSQVFGAYVSNVLDITPSLHAHLALRMDYFDNKGTRDFDRDTTTGTFSQTAFSPRVGLVYEAVKNKISLFANYQNGFRNVAPVVQPLPDVSGDFKPQQAEQWEAGIKTSLLNNRLDLTASYYDITVSNMTRPESIEHDGQTYNITVQDGTRLSRGVELDLTAAPVDGLNILLSYSHNYSKTTKAAPSVNNLRPTEAGPKNLFNAWLHYTLQRSAIKGLGLGIGVNHAGENIITNSVPTGIFTLPSYTLLNASISYTYKNYELAIKGNNLTDRTYFKGWSTVNPMMPRNILGSIAYRF